MSLKVSATNESQKTTFDGLGKTSLFKQSGGKSTQSPTHPPTSHEQHVIQISEGNQKDKEDDFFQFFGEIKKKNEELKLNTYTQFQKHSSSSQARLLSVFDSKKGKMQMAFLQAQIREPRTAVHYQKQTSFEFNVKDVHPIGQIEMHKQTS